MRSRLLISALTTVFAATLTIGVGVAQAHATAAAPTRAQIIKVMTAVNKYWIANGPNQDPNNWENAAFNVGNLAFVTTTGVSNHYTLPWCQKNKFLLQSDPARPLFPDFQAAGEAYLDLQAFHNDPKNLTDLRDRLKNEVASVEEGNAAYWDYVDALPRAMPVLARIAVLDKKPTYLAAMQTLFNHTQNVAGGNGLYDDTTGLWWRDASSVGTHTYWSRGNGWAIATMAKVLQALPANDPRRPTYIAVLSQMAAALKNVQRADGFWNVDLGDPKNFNGPETSGTALITYGITWGINNGVLDKATYQPVVERAWMGMTDKAVKSNGLLGYVQVGGSKPSDSQPVKATDTAAYAVGAFLIAGQQMATLEKS